MADYSRVRIVGVDAIEGGMAGLNARLRSFVVPLGQAAEILELDTQEQFFSQGAHHGTPWKPLADSTIAKRERATKPPVHHFFKAGKPVATWMPLTREGGTNFQVLSGGPLQKSFSRGGEHHVEQISDLSLQWGSSMMSEHRKEPHNIAAVHHFGGGNVPARPILAVTERVVDQIARTFLEWAESGWQRLSPEQPTQMTFGGA